MSSPRRSSHLRISAASLFVRLPPDYAGHAARKHLLCSKRHSHPQISKHPSPSCASRSCGLKILLFYHRSQRSMDGLDHELCRMTRVSPQGFNSHLPLRLECRRCMQRQTGVSHLLFNPEKPGRNAHASRYRKRSLFILPLRLCASEAKLTTHRGARLQKPVGYYPFLNHG